MATSNPIFKNLEMPESSTDGFSQSVERATFGGVVYKTGVLLVVFTIGAAWGWAEVRSLLQKDPAYGTPIFWVFAVSVLAGMALVWLTVRWKKWSPISAPVYAMLEGAVIGLLSAGYNRRYPGIVNQAVGLTVTICVCLLAAYGLGWIRVTAAFNRKLSVAISGVVLYYLGSLGLLFMGVRRLPALTAGLPGIAVSVVIVAIAGMGLVSNLDAAVQCAHEKLPKYMEWYLALGLIVTLVWMYIEVLRLLSRARKAEGQ